MDFETCSWCCNEVSVKELRETNDGALICKNCRDENPDTITRKVDL